MEVFLVRNNFGSKNEKQKLNDDIRKSLYDLNEVGILIDQPNEKEYWKSRLNKTDNAGKKHLFIDRWLQLLKALENEDVLIVSTYLGIDQIKIGRIEKLSKYKKHLLNEEVKTLKFELIKEFSKNEYPIFNSIIPQQTTISRIVKMRDFVNSFSKNEVLPLQLRYLSNIACEIICTEWLRSPLSGAAQIKFQYLKTGGNLRDIDIYGFSLNNEELIAQVTSSNDQNLVNKKIEKLIEYKEIPIKIMFCQSLQESNRGNCQIIHIEKVFNDLLQNGYEMLIKKLIQG